MAQLRITQELKFFTTTSEIEINRRTSSNPSVERMFRMMPSLLALASLKLPAALRPASMPAGVEDPAPLHLPSSVAGHSTLITCAPKAPSQRVAQGPALTQVKSSTRNPASACGGAIATP